LTEVAENGALGVGVKVGVLEGTGVSVAGTKFAGVFVGGASIVGRSVAVGEVNTVGVGVHVGSICSGVMVAVGIRNSAGLSGLY